MSKKAVCRSTATLGTCDWAVAAASASQDAARGVWLPRECDWPIRFDRTDWPASTNSSALCVISDDTVAAWDGAALRPPVRRPPAPVRPLRHPPAASRCGGGPQLGTVIGRFRIESDHARRGHQAQARASCRAGRTTPVDRFVGPSQRCDPRSDRADPGTTACRQSTSRGRQADPDFAADGSSQPSKRARGDFGLKKSCPSVSADATVWCGPNQTAVC